VSAVLAFEQTPETDRGRLLYQMLLTVHAGIRGELARVERLAVAVVDGLSADGLNEELEALGNDTVRLPAGPSWAIDRLGVRRWWR
jgi:hypothetical protein